MSPVQRERFGRGCDALVHGGVITLLVFSPLAFGTVHAWSQAIVELVVAALLVAWALKLLVRGNTTEAGQRLRRWCAPLVGFGAVAVIQLMPLPPPLLRVLSPTTYALYRDTLPGWPAGSTFEDVRGAIAALAESAPGEAPSVAQLAELAQHFATPASWRPLSIYGYRDGEQLLRMLTYSAVFFCSSDTLGNAAPAVAA
jgi:hypothetical protein